MKKEEVKAGERTSGTQFPWGDKKQQLERWVVPIYEQNYKQKMKSRKQDARRSAKERGNSIRIYKHEDGDWAPGDVETNTVKRK